MPSLKEIWNAQAGFLWNVLCCPFVGTIGLLVRSIRIYCEPCVYVLLHRCVVRVLWQYCCCCFSWPYQDEEFYGAKALGDELKGKNKKKLSAKELQKETSWVRAGKLDMMKGKRPQLFEGHIEPSDLCQGAVGDCWLVAALACASEFPDAIRNLFITKEYNPRGLYKVRIFDPIKKKFVRVIVDDRIPCYKNTGKPRFMKPNGNELWAIILEKAYAKFCGSYANIEGGFVLWAWHSMTGDNVFQMSLSTKHQNQWYREDMVAIKDPSDKRACGFRKTKEKFTEENVWTLLKKYDKQKALISASIGKVAYRNTDGPSGEQMLEKEGLVAGHAYSVIQAREVTNDKKIGVGDLKVGTNVTGTAKKFRLLQIRNPWGTFEWKGKWSDHSKLWKKYPNVKKELNFVKEDDGMFWMAFEDFIKIYTRINICDRTTSSDHSLDVNEDDGSCGIITGLCCGCANYWLCCKGFRNLYCAHESTDETLSTKEKCCFIC